jgi:hypothetical protein
MRLGEFVQQLRIGDVDGYEDAERRQFLDSLGFQWGDLALHLRFRFYPTYLGLRTYFHLWGMALPPPDFVVPTEEIHSAEVYPAWMRGMPLGLWAGVLRVQQQVLKLHYPERFEMFNDLEMVWWMPPAGLPDKYFQPLGDAPGPGPSSSSSSSSNSKSKSRSSTSPKKEKKPTTKKQKNAADGAEAA